MKCDLTTEPAGDKWAHRCKRPKCKNHKTPRVTRAPKHHCVCTAPCVHIGMPTGRLVECPSCAGTVRLKVLACDIHGECLTTHIDGIKCCQTCQDYDPK